MKIDQVDFFYLSMPRIEDVGDGSQDALLVRLEAGGNVGWGECEAAPLVSIASWICPMSPQRLPSRPGFRHRSATRRREGHSADRERGPGAQLRSPADRPHALRDRHRDVGSPREKAR